MIDSTGAKRRARSDAVDLLKKLLSSPALRAGRGAALRPPPFPVRTPRGGRTPWGSGGPQSGFVGQNLVLWVIALLEH